jgi:hypothetical protein
VPDVCEAAEEIDAELLPPRPRTLCAKRALQEQDCRSSEHEHPGSGTECQGGAQGDERAGERWPDELVEHRLRAEKPCVRTLELLATDERGHERASRSVRQDLAGPENERRGVDGGQSRAVGGRCEGENSESGDASGMSQDGESAAIEAVDERTRRKREDRPWKSHCERHVGNERR